MQIHIYYKACGGVVWSIIKGEVEGYPILDIIHPEIDFNLLSGLKCRQTCARGQLEHRAMIGLGNTDAPLYGQPEHRNASPR